MVDKSENRVRRIVDDSHSERVNQKILLYSIDTISISDHSYDDIFCQNNEIIVASSTKATSLDRIVYGSFVNAINSGLE